MKIWVLTCEYNEYDQHGQYYIKSFKSLPTKEEIKEVISSYIANPTKFKHDFSDDFLNHVLAGGGRRSVEYQWYNLFIEVI